MKLALAEMAETIRKHIENMTEGSMLVEPHCPATIVTAQSLCATDTDCPALLTQMTLEVSSF